MAFLANLLVRVGVDAKDLTRGLDTANRSVKRFAEDLSAVGTRLSIGISLPLAGVGVAALRAAGQIEQASVAFTTMTKSVEVAQRHMAEIRKFAIETPFEFPELVDASRKLQAYGFSVSQVIPLLRDIGNATSALGGGTEILNRIIIAMGQIRSKGALQSQEMRQLAEAGIPAWEALAKSLNVDVATAMKMVEERGVDSATALTAVLTNLRDRFAGGMEAQSKTLIGLWKRVSEQAFFTLAGIGNALAPLGKDLVDQYILPALNKVQELATAFGNLPKPIQATGIAVGGLAIGLPILTVGMGILITNAIAVGAAFAKFAAITAPLAAGGIANIAAQLGLITTGAGAASIAMQALATTTAVFAIVLAGVKIGEFAKLLYDVYRAQKAAGESGDLLKSATFRLADSLQKQSVQIHNLRDQYDTGQISLEKYRLELIKLATAQAAVVREQQRAQGISAEGINLETVKKAFEALKQSPATELRAELSKAQDALALLRAALATRMPGVTLRDVQEAEGHVKKLREQLSGTGDAQKIFKQAFQDLGIRDLRGDLEEAERALELLRSSGKLAGNQLAEAIAEVERRQLALNIALGEGIENVRLFKPPAEFKRLFPTDLERQQKALNDFLHEQTELLISAGAYWQNYNERVSEAQGIVGRLASVDVQSITVLAPDDETTRRIERMGKAFEGLGSTSSQALRLATKAAEDFYAQQKRAFETTGGIEATRADLLRAESDLNQKRLDMLRDMLYEQTGEERKATEERIRLLEKVERKNRDALNKITGDTSRRTQEISEFWRRMGRQVSTILTDLSRSIVDVLFPRKTGASRDAEAITALGIAAGVSGKQLDELAAVVERVALATGQSFSQISEAAGELFRAFDVDPANQVRTLERLYAVSKLTGIGISDLMASLSEGVDVFKAMGVSVDDAAILLGKLSQSGEDVKKVVGSLQSAMQKLSEQGFVKPGEELQEIIERIRTAGTESQATALAVKYFGSEGQAMARIIRSGKLEVADLSSELDAAARGLTDAAQNAKDLAQESGKLKQIVNEVGRAIVRAFVEEGARALIDYIRHSKSLKAVWEDIRGVFVKIGSLIVDLGRRFLEWIGILEKSKAISDTLSGVSSAVSGASSVASGVSGAAGGTAGAVGGASGGIGGGIGGAIGGLAGAANPINLVSGVVSAVAGVISAIGTLRLEGTMNAVEHNTRYSMMYLGERADGGILGTLFKIHETLSWGAGVKALERIRDEIIRLGSFTGAGSITPQGQNPSEALTIIKDEMLNLGAGYINPSLDTIKDHTGKMAGWDLGNVLTSIRDAMRSAASPQLALATAAPSGFASESVRSVSRAEQYSFYYNDNSISGDANVMTTAKELARQLRARGVRHAPKLR